MLRSADSSWSQQKNTSGGPSEADRLEFEVLPCFSLVDYMLRKPPLLPAGQDKGKGEVPYKVLPMCPYPNAIGLKSHSNLRKQEKDTAKPGIPLRTNGSQASGSTLDS